MTEEQRVRVQYDHKQATNAILLWKAHLLRTVTKEKAKQDILANLGKGSTLMIMDRAMKFQPMKFRERVDDFFGKHGRSWHVTCAIKREDDGRLEVDTFVHLFDSCVQDWFSVASIIEHTLSVMKMEDPQLTKVFLRSDNAGCYHNTELLLSLKSMGDRYGVVIERYDFSDPQSGKDVCDRRIASMKTHIRRWVNEGHGVTTALEMKVSLESHGGVRSCRFAVVEIDKTQLNAQVKKIRGISFLNNFQFGEDGILSWKAYQVGKGHFYPYSSLVNSAQRETGIIVVVPFSSPSSSSGAVAGHSSSSCGLLSCAEDGCVKMFANYEELQYHLDAECHIFMEEQDTTYDAIKKKWANILSSVSLPNQGSLPQKQTSYSDDVQYQQPVEGWTLKTVQKSTRMPDHVRNYLIQKFNVGAQKGNKADPKKVEHEMKHTRKPTGGLLFQSYEWRTCKQIASFFSSLSKSQREKGVEGGVEDFESKPDDDPTISTGQDKNFETLQLFVERQIEVDHPIVFQQHNLCQLAKEGRMGELRLDALKKACLELEVQVTGAKTKKETFVSALQKYIFTHSSKGCKYCRIVY